MLNPSTAPVLAPSPYTLSECPGVHSRDQGEVGGEGEGTLGATDGHYLILHGLSHDLQNAGAELRYFVQEQHPVVGKIYLPRS